MRLLFTIYLFLFSVLLFSQNVDRIVNIERSVYNQQQPMDWGADNLILNYEPVGPMYGIQKLTGEIYLAINDTLLTTNLGLIILSSTDNGDTWTDFGQGIGYRGHYDNIKLVKNGLDSIYCFFQIGTDVYSWNFLSGNLNQFPFNGYRSFDVVASSSGALYLFLDSLANNSIVRYSSLNGGANWGTRGLITTAGANPITTMSGTGDTLILNYYGPVLTDTATSIIRQARYRELAPGTLGSAGFIDVVTDNSPKAEYLSAFNNGESWIVYTSGTVGSRNIYGRKSIDNGATYGAPILLAGNANTDEYWFDIKYYKDTGSDGGFDFLFYSDSAQSGSATLGSGQLFYSSVPYGSTTFSSFQRINEYPVTFSANNYTPKLISINVPDRDVAALYVGESGADKKVFFDKLSAIIPVELISFNAYTNGNNVQLQWSTATETNNNGFEIERNAIYLGEGLGEVWENIGFVPGFGTSTEMHNYSFTDGSLQQGKYQYRLKQIDFNGSYEYSNIVEAEIITPLAFSLEQNYPNPFNPASNIQYAIGKQSFVTLKVFDVLGNEVSTLVNEVQDAGVYNVQFTMNNLPASRQSLSSGIYFYTIKAGDFTQTRKMILLK